MGAFVRARLKGVDDVDDLRASGYVIFVQVFGVATAIGVFVVTKNDVGGFLPARHAFEQLAHSLRVTQ